jgi:Bromodomain
MLIVQRCHRIGQTKDVRIYRLVTSRSFEQEMFDRASKKLGLEQAVLGTFGHDEDDDKPTNKEMEQLLKKGAYALLGDDNDEIVKQFCADDIESILATRTRTRVVEGTKTASWLNKQGMVVNKSKFTSDTKSANLDMDDPLFWQKVMPDFVTPSIMSRQLQDLSDEIFGIKRKRGRGRWRDKLNDEKKDAEAPSMPVVNAAENASANEVKASDDHGNGDTNGDDKVQADASADDVDPEHAESELPRDEAPALGNDEEPDGAEPDGAEPEDDEDDDDEDDNKPKPKFQLTRTHQRKIAKFISDLKSMMEGLLDEAEDDNLLNEEKATTQKLLLNVSVKEKIFNEEQRRFAKTMLKRLEGDRRRRCRTADQTESFSPGRRNKRGQEGSEIREELRIVRRKIKKRRKKGGEESEHRRERKNGSEAGIGDDGYKMHSDDEDEWSDVADDLYGQSIKKKATITTKEARRRRQWAGDDDAATAAGRAWPALPRTEVAKVLGTLLDQVMKHDDAKGGIFSVPVPRDEFPEYYEQIKNPMDYGTMKKKLENGEYRSAQGMQKDFILVMQNCLKFNAADSEIVQEARQQALMRPNLLRAAALKHNLFLSEDGSVLFIDDDNKGNEDTDAPTKKRGRPKKKSREEDETTVLKKQKKTKGHKRARDEDNQMDLGVEEDDVPLTSMKKKKPRIKISLKFRDGIQRKKPKLTSDDNHNSEDMVVDKAKDADDVETTLVASKKNARKSSIVRKEEELPKRRGRKRSAKQGDSVESDRDEDDGNGVNVSSPRSDGDGASAIDSEYMDVALLKKEREALDDKSFEAARGLFTKRGAWILPSPLSPEKFSDIALLVLKKIEKIDRYSVFAEPVSDSDAPGYSEIVSNPIDLSTIRSKIENAGYGACKGAARKLYADLLLMFDNCRLYNDDDGEVTEEAARIFAVVPEIYGGACATILKKQKK